MDTALQPSRCFSTCPPWLEIQEQKPETKKPTSGNFFSNCSRPRRRLGRAGAGLTSRCRRRGKRAMGKALRVLRCRVSQAGTAARWLGGPRAEVDLPSVAAWMQLAALWPVRAPLVLLWRLSCYEPPARTARRSKRSKKTLEEWGNLSRILASLVVALVLRASRSKKG